MVIIVSWINVAQILVNKGVFAAGVQYRVKQFTIQDPDTISELRWGWATSRASAATINQSADTAPHDCCDEPVEMID